ncbi:(2Fe-2S)-binding protein [Pseudonocardia sp. H11422]|uniref:(2Fe-2S)-binding protein n=1 Tax=Pseudonocardia sp. H11422 TaxID=2835866 RepID=UPI001BDD7B5D|nr:(2Fe-2S)-binding protein [Pseudonocardia sp. H11422]
MNEQMPDDPAAVKLPDSDGRVPVRLGVNGRSRTLRVRTTQTLLDALREQLRLHGARNGCGVGMCGACTVLLDGRAASGCLTLAALCDGAEVRTVEGLESPSGELSRVQEAFLRHRAFQCSYCTSGFVLALEALLVVDPAPDETAIREAFSGHICRCGSYSRIMAAALEVAGTADRREQA